MTYQLGTTTITFEAALRDLASRNDKVRAQAAHALGYVLEPDLRARAVSALIEVLTDGRDEVRTEAALALGELDSEAAVAPLVDRFDDPAPAVRQAAVIALGRLGFASAFDPLARALAHGPPDLRFQAATSVVEIDDERAREPLLAALADSDGEVVGAAALALGAVGETRARDQLAELLETWSRPRTRFDLAYALADLGDDRALDVLAASLHAGGDQAWDAVEAMERLGDSRAVAMMAPVVERRSGDPAVRLRAAGAVCALDPAAPVAKQARSVLLDGLRARKRERRGLAVLLLGRVGGAWAIEPLRDLRARRAGRPFVDDIDEAIAQLSNQASNSTHE